MCKLHPPSGALVAVNLARGGAGARAQFKQWLLQGLAGGHCLGGCQVWSWAMLQSGSVWRVLDRLVLLNLLLLFWDWE